MKRRDLIVGGGLVALAAGWQVFGVRKPELTFRAIKDAPGWHFGQIGSVSSASGADLMTIGLSDGSAPLGSAELEEVVHRDALSGAVPVAVFSDFFCPYCRVLISRLALRSATPRIAISWHELPLLGPGSVLVAKSAEAAALQGGYDLFYTALSAAGFRPSPAWMAAIATQAGLDGAQFQRDLNGPEVAARLMASARAAKTLGIIGTPGLVVGRRAVLGALERDQMERLFEQTEPLA